MKIMITEEKKEKLGEYTEKILHYAEKMMSCVEQLDDESDEDEESEFGERHGYRMGMREHDEGDSGTQGMGYGERRSRGSRRYSRY